MIKPITLDTLPDILPLFDAYRVFYQKIADSEQAKTYLQTRLRQHEAIIFAFYEENKAVAFTLCYFTFSSTAMSKTLQLNDLFVAETHRNQGIGEKLIQHVFAYADENDFARVGIETAHDNVGAQRLYARIGFEQTSAVHYKKVFL